MTQRELLVRSLFRAWSAGHDQRLFSAEDEADAILAAVSPAEQVGTEPEGRSAPNLDAGVVGDLVDSVLLSDCYRAMAAAMAVIDADAGPGRTHSNALQSLADCRVRIEQRSAALAKYATQGTGGVGPRPTGNTCRGCPSFETEDWREPSGDGETYDSGTYARCLSADGRSIGGAYAGRSPRTPDWCPATHQPAISTDRETETATIACGVCDGTGLHPGSETCDHCDGTGDEDV